MKHTDFGRMPCPIARSLGKVGEWWSILILRDAFYGLSRFDEFEKSLKIAPNMLTRRLNGLVEGGLMERRQYSARPPPTACASASTRSASTLPDPFPRCDHAPASNGRRFFCRLAVIAPPCTGFEPKKKNNCK